MKILLVLAIGGLVHALIGATVYFSPDEPNKAGILAATTIKGLLVALLIGFTIAPDPGWLNGIGFGVLYGFAFGLVVFLAKGGFKSAPYVIIASAVQGAIAGGLIGKFAFGA